MDLNRIFMKNANPTKVGGQAILEGLMMRGSRAIAVAIREPSGNIHLSVEPLKPAGVWKKIPKEYERSLSEESERCGCDD